MTEHLLNNKLLSWALLVAIVGDFAVPYLLSIFYKGYNHNLMVMSSLGNPSSPVRVPYNIWIIALGVLLILSSTVVTRKYWLISKPLTIATLVLIFMFAIGAGILSGIFSVNESKDDVTLASKIHGAGASIGFMTLLFVPLLLAILSYKSNLTVVGVLFTVSFVLAFVFFVLFVMADKPQFQNTLISNEGLWQRLTLLFMYFPLGYIAVENLIYSMRIN